jgi:hypothetical protein
MTSVEAVEIQIDELSQEIDRLGTSTQKQEDAAAAQGEDLRVVVAESYAKIEEILAASLRR